MKQSRPVLRYAKAVLNLATDNNKEAEVNQNMKLILKTIAENNSLRIMLKSPVIRVLNKKKVLIALFDQKVNNIVKGLFNLLEENKRMIFLEAIAKQYTVIYNYHKSLQVAKLTTAVPVSNELKAKALHKVEELTGNKSNLENVVNPEILGGFVLRIGDLQYDASIANQLNELKKEFDNSYFISKI
ncbi:MAG: ATP synthase F1 subunit delta [Tenacibaculum sp.]